MTESELDRFVKFIENGGIITDVTMYNCLYASIKSKIEDGEQFEKQVYHYKTNFEQASKIFNDLTEEEYEKYASAFSIMTWIANELADQKDLESQVAKLEEERNSAEKHVLRLNEIVQQNKSALDKIEALAEDKKVFENMQGFECEFVDVDELKEILAKLRSEE